MVTQTSATRGDVDDTTADAVFDGAERSALYTAFAG